MRKLILLFTLVSPLAGLSQPELRIESIAFITPPVLSSLISEAKLVDTKVRNYSSSFTFNDSIRIVVAVLDTLDQPQVMQEVNKGVVTMGPLGSGTDSTIIDTVEVNINPAFFRDGNNTVVIWPAAPNSYTIDTFTVDVFYTSVDELIKNDIDVRMGPNPASDKLFLDDPGNLVQQVRIRAMDGRLIGTVHTNRFIELNGLINGVYVVELQAGKRVYTRKLIIQR